MRNLVFYGSVLALFYLATQLVPGTTPLLPPTGELDVRDLGEGAVLPPSSRDERVLVQTGNSASSTGTAFSVAPGKWMSARHVVDGCDRLYLHNPVGVRAGRTRASSTISQQSDLSLLSASWEKPGFALAKTSDLKRGQSAFILGYPQGSPGEVRTSLIGRGRAVFRARRHNTEPVLVWAIAGRSKGLAGSVAGISGGPAFDAKGRVVGVAMAETLRRGRIYTAAPRSLRRAMSKWKVEVSAPQNAGIISRENYQQSGAYLRQSGRVVKVLCLVDR